MELLEEDLTCPICCSLFDDPRALPCSHNFCKKCLEGILEGNARNMIWRQPLFKCPTCRKETTVTGVNNLQVNYSLKGIVEKYNKIKVTTKIPLCKVHSGQPLNIFCQTDTHLICGICATRGDHIKHVFCSVEDAYLQEKLAFETLFKGFETWRCEDVLSRLDILESSKRKALQILTKDYDKVKEFFEKLQYALEQKKNEILSDFETMKLAVMQAYDPEINKLNTIVREQQMAFNIAEAFKDVSEPIIFLQQMQEFREKIKVIKETRLPCPTVDINSTMKDFDTSQWEQFKLADVDKLSLPQEKSTYNWAIPSPFSYKFIMAILFCLFILATTQVSIIDSLADTLQHCKTFISEYGSGYLTDTAEMAGHAVFYWEKITDSASVLSEKCVNYTLVMLDNVAQFVCKYKL
ncbi:E3 ubiquitin-protein ligase TRIM13 isoform X2 [Hemicordylus capensis]|nr:E3 ubiquitin-protein ligase TRIM13 isoform X2 [Hemicordylus capensis]XP_053130588.1 E3 ubiquitin-protein ligase TRIM13 isoform X2 [Hemicordylus capensis]XP_053130673.1 E3 ubiquitin-protein ligase TRIM13 isoform X2 [Hemicordylus capensis]XP_053130766.1 E3 ubiquitin-protein ligase TRIM13 isoform X2 [Hemicordylus capensis]XP_053130851.1 E3 ubiquitin-protein ligase TRIM13 isoform X2 [Hemicordylus capensis]XP_053130934.1 E3 ubiquitin-protein ligase TRIM13 isoform X2 [Hemicordylus capensis]XP_05